MPIIATIILFLLTSISLSSQIMMSDSINFYDSLYFKQSVEHSEKGKIHKVEYIQINGHLKRIDLYNSEQEIASTQILEDKVLEHVKYTHLEKGQVIKRYDVLNDKPVSPFVEVKIRYPALARENQIEGKIEVKFTFDENCIPLAFEILNSLGHGIDEEVRKKMKLLLKLSQKYGGVFKNCDKNDDNFVIHFKLE